MDIFFSIFIIKINFVKTPLLLLYSLIQSAKVLSSNSDTHSPLL